MLLPRWVETELRRLGQLRRRVAELGMRLAALELIVSNLRSRAAEPPKPKPREPLDWADDELQTDGYLEIEPDPD